MEDKHESGQAQPIFWKHYLYELQKEAPRPFAIMCRAKIGYAPNQYGVLFHGYISKRDCNKLLKKDGSYLVRKSFSAPNNFTLTLRSCGNIKHYKLYYDGSEHYVGDKKFLHLDDLVADGLVVLYLESRAGHLLQHSNSKQYEQSPYYTLRTSVQKALLQTHKLNVSTTHNHLSTTHKSLGKSDSDDYGTIMQEKTIRIASVEKKSGSNKLHESHVNLTTSNESICIRPHRFQTQSFKGLHWCGYCGNFLWGLMLQGVKCQDCGLQTHRHCSLKVPNDCCPDMRDFHCIFGMDLGTSLQLVETGERSVPQIVIDCIAEVDARGLLIEGIYRVSGSQEQIDALKLSFERDAHNICLNEKTVGDINAVAGLLKLYLRLLPIRLITQECFQMLIIASQITIRESKILKIKDSLETLSIPHYSTLRLVIQHLSRVCHQSVVNKMTATSIGTIFGPTIVESQENKLLQPSELLVLKISAQEPRIVEMLVLFSGEIFSW